MLGGEEGKAERAALGSGRAEREELSARGRRKEREGEGKEKENGKKENKERRRKGERKEKMERGRGGNRADAMRPRPATRGGRVRRVQAGFAAWSTAGRPRAHRAERRMGQRVFGTEKRSRDLRFRV